MGYTEVKLIANNRTVEFVLRHDPDFISDRNTRFMLTQPGGVEPEVVHLMMRVVQPGDLVVDAGANVGFFTLLLSKLVGPTGKVLAFEPGCNNLPVLRENLRLNKVSNVTVIEQPLWDKEEEVTLYLAPDSGINSLVKHDDCRGSQKMMATTLGPHMQRLKSFKLFKLDVEGAEHKVLSLGLYQSKYIVCELNENMLSHFNSSQVKLRQHMFGRGRDTFLLHPDGSLPTLVPPATRIEPRYMNCNILFTDTYRVGEAWPIVEV